jgi:hypothetical protein
MRKFKALIKELKTKLANQSSNQDHGDQGTIDQMVELLADDVEEITEPNRCDLIS